MSSPASRTPSRIPSTTTSRSSMQQRTDNVSAVSVEKSKASESMVTSRQSIHSTTSTIHEEEPSRESASTVLEEYNDNDNDEMMMMEEEEQLFLLEEEGEENLLTEMSVVDFVDEELPEEEEIEEEEPFVSVFERLDAPREYLDQPEPITAEILKDISVRLGQIRLCWPKQQKLDINFMPNVILPDGYLMNTNKEKLLLLYCENFRQQYHQRFPNRKPLLLAGDNVVGQRKMVCTTLRPTTLTFPNLSTWQELASFISDHIQYEPLNPPTDLKEEEEKVEEASKYAVKPPKDLRSKFLLAMEQKDIDKRKREIQMQEEKKAREAAEKEQAPFDELYGRRIHGWVLMYPNEPDQKPFFIEATTGMSHQLDSPLYCSIQSVWNNVNYYVNLQDDSIGLGNLDYDLTNLDKWEHILAGEPIQGRIHKKNLEIEEYEDEEAAELQLIMDEKHLDMPEPWSLRINIPYSDVATRFPKGQKKTMFKRTIVEQYSPYLLEDGLVMKVYRYSDIECTDLRSIDERYENRSDKMYRKTEDLESGFVSEYFTRGREDNAKVHYYYRFDNYNESWRKIEFYYKSRFDCLELIIHDTLSLIEQYIGRADKFKYRHTVYARRGEPPPGHIEGPRRIIKSVVEKFDRTETKRASDDIAVREFDYIGRRMHLKFHYDTGKITASTRTFIKPPLTEMVEGVSFHPELTYGYQAEMGANPPKNSTLYSLLEQQLKEEEEGILKIRYVEDIIAEFIKLRTMEVMKPKLDIGLFNREQNKEHRIGMLEKEAIEKTKKEREIEEELDFIQPYLIRYRCAEALKYSQAIKVRDQCLTEFKGLLLWRANDLQQQFQDQIAWLKTKYDWYNTELDNLAFEEEQEYFRSMNIGNFRLHCLELRMIRHRELVPSRMQALYQYLDNHPKLEIIRKMREKMVAKRRTSRY